MLAAVKDAGAPLRGGRCAAILVGLARSYGVPAESPELMAVDPAELTLIAAAHVAAGA